MFQTSPGPRALRWTAGTVGVLALLALGATPATPAAADDPSPGVVLGKIAPVDGVEPGSTFQVPVGFTNTGTEALGKVWLSYSLSHGLSRTELAELPSNCKYLTIPSVDEAPDSTEAICEFDQTVKTGVVYTPEKQLAIRVRDSALYDHVRVGVNTDGFPYPGDNFSHPVPGTAPAVKLVEQPDATPAPSGSAKRSFSDATDATVTAVNTADFKVAGARLKGAVGDTVPLTVRLTNAGPAWVQRNGDTRGAEIVIKMPAGTTVVKNDSCLKRGSGRYACGTGPNWVKEGDEENYTFQLKIDKAVPGARGSVELTGPSRPFDTVTQNDKADIRLDVAGGDGASGGDTANTGAGTALPLVGAAAAVAALGAGAFLVARRRAHRR
ncbi:hypothetical protein [Streptomyces sp. NPDC001507]|uniref:hypothetical protein n=1 Tax=Streptomyces sp. NPDC001507 TaxID=3364579 RepID=UPI00369D13AE